MSDNQRVSGWSVLCFRTPTITTPVRRCIKPQTAGAFLFFSSDSPKNCATKQIGCGFFLNIGSGAFSLKSQAELFKVGLVLPLESNMKTARKPQEPSLNGRHCCHGQVSNPWFASSKPSQVFRQKTRISGQYPEQPRAIPEVIWLPAKAAWILQKIVSLSFFVEIFSKKHISAHIWSNYVKLLNTETMWYPSLGVFDVWISNAIISPDIVRCFSFSVVVLGCVSSNSFKVCSTKSIRMRTSYWSNVMKQQVQVGVKCPKQIPAPHNRNAEGLAA